MSCMIDLIDEIANSDISKSIYAYTSMSSLCLGQHEEMDEGNAKLVIEPNPSKDTVLFKYTGDNSFSVQWQKEVSASDIFYELEMFIKEMKWAVYYE